MSNMILSGRYFNFLNRPGAGVTSPFGGSDSNLPLSCLYDYFTDRAGKFFSASSQQGLIRDNNLVANPNLSQWATPAFPEGWTVGGVVAQDGTYSISPSSLSCKLSPGSFVQQVLQARSSELWRIDWQMMGANPATARLRVRCRESGNYLTIVGGQPTWVPPTGSPDIILGSGVILDPSVVIGFSSVDLGVAAAGAGSWVPGTLQFQMEPYQTTLTFAPTLEITVLNNAASGSAWLGLLQAYPATSWLSFHWHNIFPASPAYLYSSDTGAFAGEQVLEGQVPLKPKSCYLALQVPSFHRYEQILIQGTPPDAIWSGEWVLGQYVALIAGAAMDGSQYFPKLVRTQPQVRNATIAGSLAVQNLAPSTPRSLQIPFKGVTYAQYQNARDEFYLRSEMGGYPMVFAPADYDPDTVVFGYLEQTETEQWDFTQVIESGATIDETPGPLVTA